MKNQIILIIICLLSVSNLFGQTNGFSSLTADSLKLGEKFDRTQGYSYLTQNWRYHAGDPAEAVGLWTRPDFADSSWEVIDSRLPLEFLPQNGWSGAGWFRLHLIVDSLLLNRPLAFNLFHYGASEVYLDGDLLYQFGKVGGSRVDEDGFNALGQQPKFIVFHQTKPLIVVRYSGFNVLHSRPPTMTELGFRVVIGDLNHSQMLRGWHTRFFTYVEALTIAVPLSFAVLHFLLFLFHRSDRANFYFALFTATIGLWGLLEHRPFYVTDANTALLLLRLAIPYAAVMPLVALRCLYSFFYLTLPRQFWMFALVGTGLAVWTWFASASGMVTFMFVMPLLEMLRVVVTVIRGKAPGAWIIGVGFAAFSLSLLALLALIGLFGIFSVLLFYGMIYGLGVSSLLLSMSIYLSHNVSRTSRSLEAEMKKSLQLEVDSARKEVELQKAEELKAAYQELDTAHTNLKTTQQQLVTQEKLASLGQLTAGIAHEIKNPLNFVNNFSSVSVELVDEALEEFKKTQVDHNGNIPLLLGDIRVNLTKIIEHGKRADSIVKSMLQHSRGGSGKKEPTDLNVLVKEYASLAFHGMRSGKDPINVDMKLELDPSIGNVLLIAEDFSRVILNLCQNAFDAMREKLNSEAGKSYLPKLMIRTWREAGKVNIRIEDNGPGIPDAIKEKVMQPFFTTKKGTQGTGLGLSITHDIVKAHGGELSIETHNENGATFLIVLPG